MLQIAKKAYAADLINDGARLDGLAVLRRCSVFRGHSTWSDMRIVDFQSRFCRRHVKLAMCNKNVWSGLIRMGSGVIVCYRCVGGEVFGKEGMCWVTLVGLVGWRGSFLLIAVRESYFT
jgi:hypothetical protein